MTNREIRSWYLREVAKIAALDEEWQERGDSIENRARQAWQHRHELRLRAREMMDDQTDMARLRARDLRIYGNSDGPGFEDLVEAAVSKGSTGNRSIPGRSSNGAVHRREREQVSRLMIVGRER